MLKLLNKIVKAIPFYLKLYLHGVKFGARVGGNNINIINNELITIGNHVSLNSFPNGEMFKVELFAYFNESSIEIGDQCNLNGTIIFCRKKVVIGNYCMFGPGVVISDNSSHNQTKSPVITGQKSNYIKG